MKYRCRRCNRMLTYGQLAVTDDGFTCCPVCENLGIETIKEEQDIALDCLRKLKDICKKHNEECPIYYESDDSNIENLKCPLKEYCDTIYGIGFPCTVTIDKKCEAQTHDFNRGTSEL